MRGWRPPLAFVRDELFLDEGVCILRPDDSLRICRELGIAIFTYAKHRNIVLSFDDLKLAFRGVLQCLGAWLPSAARIEWMAGRWHEKADVTPPPRAQPTQSVYAVTSSCCLRVELTTSKV